MDEDVLDDEDSEPLSPDEELKLDFLLGVCFSEDTMLCPPIIPGLILILMLLLVLLSDFFVFLHLDLLKLLIGEKVVLDLTALPRLLAESPPTFMIDGSM